MAESQGFEAWPVRYNGPGNGLDISTAIAVDAKGNLYVTGHSTGVSSGSDYTTFKYGPAGELLWAKRYNGPGNGDDSATAIAADPEGNVYVTGSSMGTDSQYDYATIKYSADGERLWTKRYNGPENRHDGAAALALDSEGNVYVTGSSQGVDLPFADYATIKYSPAGEVLWAKRYNGPGNGQDGAKALAVDAEGNVYVTGYSAGKTSDFDYATIKYSPTGERLWTKRYNGPGNGYDVPFAIALDAQRNVYVTGYSAGVDTSNDYTIVKYAP